MSKAISVAGHTWQREFFHTDSQQRFHRYAVPGGALLMAQLLEQAGVSALAAPAPQSLRTQYLELAAGGERRLLVSRESGFREGAQLLPPSKGKKSAPALLWDEGWGSLTPPADAPVLWASNKALPGPEAMQALAGRCMLVLDANVLREAGAMVSRQVSWERTATELVWQLQNNPNLTHLLLAEHILVFLAEDGAVYLRRREGSLSATLHLLHGGGEGTLRESAGGCLPDAWAAMVFCCALRFESILAGSGEADPLEALTLAGRLWEEGYSLSLLEEGCAFGSEVPSIPQGSCYPIPKSGRFDNPDPDYWCISHNFGGGTLYDLACDTVLEGLDRLKGLPRMSFGALTTVDRREIEAYQNIKNLITSYAASNSVRPLSIAVFGAPGSGKSFGVTQIAKNVLPGRVEKVEFNVSQFTSGEDLAGAFHQIRDVILAGKLPLVFFDEFDSSREGVALGWLKSFLMPMQDGKFRDGSREHPVGKCIFVFAGGTAASFQEFCIPMQYPGPNDFKAVKGPDFVSRLRGTIDVLGPNQADGGEQNFILRRALLLRSFCERRFKDQIKGGQPFIDHNVLRAMLLVPKYLHGARSMESVLDMSSIEGAVWDAAELPFHRQLALHVDAAAFLRLVQREVILASYTGELAKAIHRLYVEKNLENPRTDDPSLEDWDDLAPELQYSNVRQARSIERKLRAVGCGYDAGDTPYPTVTAFTEQETQLLARLEHDLWVQERIAEGWKQGPKKDVANKITPYLVPWESLNDNLKQLDRDTVDNIIPLLDSIGLRVYRKI